jgi:hypothetical protein
MGYFRINTPKAGMFGKYYVLNLTLSDLQHIVLTRLAI